MRLRFDRTVLAGTWLQFTISQHRTSYDGDRSLISSSVLLEGYPNTARAARPQRISVLVRGATAVIGFGVGAVDPKKRWELTVEAATADQAEPLIADPQSAYAAITLTVAS